MEGETPIEEIEVDEDYLGDKPPEEIVSDDGTTTTVLLEDEVKPSSGEWFGNLAESLSSIELNALAENYLELIDKDILDRKKRDEMQADGIKKAGIGDPAPGGADFEGASRVTHPVLAESYIDFAASAIKELFPPNGPVKMKIEGKPNKEKMDRAKRKSEFMNWQLIREIPSYRPELERLLTQLPVGGSQYMKLYWDEGKGRPDVEFVPIDDIIIPYNAKNFFNLSRKFHKMTLSNSTFQDRVLSGVYIDYSLPDAYATDFTKTQSARATDKIEGKDASAIGETEERVVYEGCIYESLAGDKKAPDDRTVPYLITIDEESRKVLSIYRNWDENDDKCREIEYLVDFTFIPWRGVFGLSLLQCLGGLPDTLTGALRALMDSALISNTQGGIKLKGNPNGASLSVNPTQITEVDALGADDIRKVYMPIPFNQPSPVLFQLLGFCTSAAKEVVGTAEEKIADGGANMPVGTTLALIEQGAKVFSAIHARIQDSQRRCLEILHRLNRDHLPDGKVMFGSDDEDFVTRDDFKGSMDVRPVSDPNIFSETQRFAQIQFVMQTVNAAAAAPALAQSISLFNLRALYARAFELAKIPDYEEFLPEIPKEQPLNPADENVAMCLGKPVKAYAGQNHEAHIQVLLDFAQNPLFGQSPIIAPKFLVPAMNHLQDHLLVWYEELMKRDAAKAIGKPVDKIDWDNDPESAVFLAKSAPVVDQASKLAFEKIPAIILKGMQSLQAMAPKPPVDPMIQVATQDVQNKHQAAMAKLSSEDKKTMLTLQQKREEAAQKAKEAEMEYDVKLRELGTTTDTELAKAELKSKTDLAMTVHDNHSNQHIARIHANTDLAKDLTNQITNQGNKNE